MVAIEGIFLVVLSVSIIVGMSVMMTSQYEIMDTFNTITQSQRESGQEDVDLNINKNGKVYIKNKSPTPVKIVEMRILDDDGNLVRTCNVDVSFSGGKETLIADIVLQASGDYVFNPNSTDAALQGNITACITNFDGN